jgi:Arc/MetJ-type ribon-helix-helix transcriptional regulator
MSVSMPPEVLAAVRARVGRREFSRYVTAALRRQFERDQLDALLAEMEAVNGPVSAEMLEEVEALWPDVEDGPR